MNRIDWPDLTFDYRGRHVLVTGGTSGIGAVIAAAYHGAGAHVCVTGTRTAAADYPEDLSGYCYLPLNVLDNDQIENVACALPQLDILVHCAGWPCAVMVAVSSTPMFSSVRCRSICRASIAWRWLCTRSWQ